MGGAGSFAFAAARCGLADVDLGVVPRGVDVDVGFIDTGGGAAGWWRWGWDAGSFEAWYSLVGIFWHMAITYHGQYVYDG